MHRRQVSRACKACRCPHTVGIGRDCENPSLGNRIWRWLRTADRKQAERAYAATHAEIELLFAQWRKAESPRGTCNSLLPLATAIEAAPLTPGLLRRLADAHYLAAYDQDFLWRGDLWKKVHDDEEAFWRGDIIRLPADDWVACKGTSHSYFALLMEEPVLEEVFLYAVFRARKRIAREFFLSLSKMLLGKNNLELSG